VTRVRIAVVLLVDPRGHVLLMERDEHAPRSAGQWGMVGGHVEEGEDFEPAAYRELAEETGLRLPPGSLRLWREERFTYSDGHGGPYHVYVAGVEATDEDIVLGEGRQIVFVDPVEIPRLDLAESARHFVLEFLASEDYRQIKERT
jgi:8-oxo-dGTP diphosphatase